jgi:hypothetical protein
MSMRNITAVPSLTLAHLAGLEDVEEAVALDQRPVAPQAGLEQAQAGKRIPAAAAAAILLNC